MTWMNIGYMVLGVVVWHITKMAGNIAADIGRKWHSNKFYKGYVKIDILATSNTTWLADWRKFWNDFGNAADQMWR